MNTKKQSLMLEMFESAPDDSIKEGIKSEVDKTESYTLTTVKIESDTAAKMLGREKGEYITFELKNMYEITDSDFEEIVSAVAQIIRSLSDIKESDCVLVVGIGNRNVTADSLGPKTIDRIIVTRGLQSTMPELIANDSFANVCAMTSNVFGITGIESAELTEGISNVISPKLIVLVDSLATKSVSRLCKTIQISNTSLSPGSGVGNTRRKINKSRTKSDVISIGMPTVLEMNGVNANGFTDDIVAMPMNIDLTTDVAAKLIAFSLNKAFHYNMSTEDILKFLY